MGFGTSWTRSTQSRHRHVTDSPIRSQWGGGRWPRCRVGMRLLCWNADVGGVLATAGCGGGSGVSSITIAPAKGRPKLPPPDALVLAQQDGSLAVALALRPWGEGIDAMATVVAPDATGKNGLKVAFQRGS